MSLDLTLDYLIFDNLETVAYFSRTGEPSPTAGGATVNNCLRIDTETAIGSSPYVTQGMAIWHLWDAELGGIVTKIGDVIQDSSGVRWDVKHRGYDVLTQHNTLATLKEK
jgi:hypothetical protein